MRFFASRWRWFKKELKKTDGLMWFLTLFISLLLLIGAFVLLIVAGHYLNANFSHLPPLPDMGHNVLPLWDLRFLTHIGLFTSLILFLIGALNEPHRMPYFFFMASFWFLIRIASMTVTPMGEPADLLPEYPKNLNIQSIWDFIVSGLAASNVLFFSGHTGLPFLGYLLFRRKITCGLLIWPLIFITGFYLLAVSQYPVWVGIALLPLWVLILMTRKQLLSLNILFLIWSFVMAASVLLIRSHYSIDVLGAYFMTAGTVVIGRYFFGKVEQLCEKMEEDFKTEC